MTIYPPEVEKWRVLVTRILREVGGPNYNPQDVDKLLHVIRYESGGNPTAAGDGGASIGLTQLNDNGLGSGMSVSDREDPEINIRTAARAIYGNEGWTPWGEGSLYQGKPFGSLGNHPYVTSEVLGQFIDTPSDIPEDNNMGNEFVGFVGTKIGKLISGSLKQFEDKYNYEAPGVYTPTGDFQKDASAYWNLAQNAWAQIDAIQQTSSNPLLIDEDQQLVFDTVTGQVDFKATRFLQQALANEAHLDRLYAAKQAGLFDAGVDAANAYLASEKEKAAEATRSYEDYVKRVSDLVAIEDIPQARIANLANTLAAINTANANKTKLSSGMLATGGPKFKDTTPFAQAIKNTIPAQAPSPYNIAPAALEPPATGIVQARPPDEILQDFQNKLIPSPAATYDPGLTGGPMGPSLAQLGAPTPAPKLNPGPNPYGPSLSQLMTQGPFQR